MNNLWMNIGDIGVITIILFSGLLSFFRGFFREILSVIAWILALFSGFYGASFLTKHLTIFAQQYDVGLGIAGGLVGLTALILCMILNRFIVNKFRFNGLTAIDRSLGFLFGLARGFFLVSLAFLILQPFNGKELNLSWVEQSKSRILLENGANVILSLVPNNFNLNLDKMGLEMPTPDKPLNFEQLNLPKIKSDGLSNNHNYSNKQRKIMNDMIKDLN